MILMFYHWTIPKKVGNGIRTHDLRHHKPTLYQLSYAQKIHAVGIEPTTNRLKVGCSAPELRMPYLYMRSIEIKKLAAGIEPTSWGHEPHDLPLIYTSLQYILNLYAGIEGIEPSSIGRQPTALPLSYTPTEK
jgi:hypothetical protein